MSAPHQLAPKLAPNIDVLAGIDSDDCADPILETCREPALFVTFGDVTGLKKTAANAFRDRSVSDGNWRSDLGRDRSIIRDG
jgi:hypothetical protein